MRKRFYLQDFKILPISDSKIHKELQSEIMNWGLQLSFAEQIWSSSKGKNVKIAVIDSGISEHDDLDGAVKCKRNFSEESSVEDTSGHGTFISGIIGARKNGIDIIGIAPECDLYIGKVLTEKNRFEIDSLAEALEWAISKNVNIISLSLSMKKPNKKIHKLIKEATDQGISVICAAGNSRHVTFPAKYSETIAVSSLDRSLNPQGGVARGRDVDFIAPGIYLRSTYYQGGVGIAIEGTSFAVPYIVGISALLIGLSQQPNYHGPPIKSVDQLRLHLIKMSLNLGVPGRDETFGFGLPTFINYPPVWGPLVNLKESDTNLSGYLNTLKSIKI